MKTTTPVFKTGRASAWPRERLDSMDREDLVQLQSNAERLGEQELAATCGEVLKLRPKRGPAGMAAASGQRKLIPRSRAFAARGIYLQDPRTSWSGVRKADGGVVMAMWQAAVQSQNGGCACLLWAPNLGGSRPWSDSAAGRERLEHCKRAIENQGAEGLLVHGESLEGRLPEDRARSVLGIDPETVIRFNVELRGAEYWATWGLRAAVS